MASSILTASNYKINLHFTKRCLLHFGSTDAAVKPIWMNFRPSWGNDVILGTTMELGVDDFGAGTGAGGVIIFLRSVH
jgi:hypothetical protein